MKGRKDHGVRRAIWKKRWMRYKRKDKRKRQTTGKRKPRPLFGSWSTHRGTPYRFVGDGSSMKPMVGYLKKPKQWPGLPVNFGVLLREHPAKYKKPPYKEYHPPIPPNPPGHDTHPDKGVFAGQVKSLRYRGRKIDRQNGLQRWGWFAYRYWRGVGGRFGPGWPYWDPQHRTPIDPASYP